MDRNNASAAASLPAFTSTVETNLRNIVKKVRDSSIVYKDLDIGIPHSHEDGCFAPEWFFLRNYTEILEFLYNNESGVDLLTKIEFKHDETQSEDIVAASQYYSICDRVVIITLLYVYCNYYKVNTSKKPYTALLKKWANVLRRCYRSIDFLCFEQFPEIDFRKHIFLGLEEPELKNARVREIVEQLEKDLSYEAPGR